VLELIVVFMNVFLFWSQFGNVERALRNSEQALVQQKHIDERTFKFLEVCTMPCHRSWWQMACAIRLIVALAHAMALADIIIITDDVTVTAWTMIPRVQQPAGSPRCAIR
jgi:hypothetical protein